MWTLNQGRHYGVIDFSVFISEVIEKRDGYEIAFWWFSSQKKAEDFCRKILDRINVVKKRYQKKS